MTEKKENLMKARVMRFVCAATLLSFILLSTGWGVAHAGTLSTEAVNAVEAVAQQQGYVITGTVVDNYGEELIGVAVQLRSNMTIGRTTDIDGNFSIPVPGMNEVLVFNFVGMATQELRLVAGTTHYHIVMQSDTRLEEVVVTGIMGERDRVSFTGAAHTISQEELRSIGNINLIQTLRTLDPSFVVMDNLLQGSNPNVMATIELRGATGLDLGVEGYYPNRPLFILDGFEATIAEVNDLDINRIRSVTLLKDASSTAIFGARGANGVVVIETIRPAPGAVQVIYSSTLRLDWADLSQYNLMNAREKLEFERLTGIFGNLNNPNNTLGIGRYNDILRRLAAGIDTYWLDMPIRLGLTQDHSLTVSGGDNVWLFASTINYRNVQGVMRGSSRESYSGNVRVTYRGVNNLNISNNLTVGGVNANDGAWTTGNSFADFANANPYHVPFNEYGVMPPFLDSRRYTYRGLERTENAPNPLYNASLMSFDRPRTFSVNNNTQLNWSISPQWRATGDVNLRRESTYGQRFIDPRHTRFTGQAHTLRGEYTESRVISTRFAAGVNLTYTTTFLDAHNFTFTGRTSIEDRVRESSSFIARGFPPGEELIPSFAYSFLEGSRPTYVHRRTREANFMLTANYNYRQRYLLDFSFNNAGTTSFGRNNLFEQFYSVGLGWNINREAFAQDWDWVDELRIRGTHGTNANQTLGSNATVYGFWPGSDVFGTASRLMLLGNPDLMWMKVHRTNIGFDARLINRRLFASFDVFRTLTDPMSMDLPRRASAGVSSYPMNLGTLHGSGYEFRISYNVIHDIQNQTILTVRLNGAGNVQRSYGFEDALGELNESFWGGEDSTLDDMLRRFEDGSRRDALWAVRSLGIDPSTGREIFQRRDGTYTFEFDHRDRVEIAHRNPIIQGVFGANLIHRRLTVAFDIRYQLGGHEFNRALFNKVENITQARLLYNQDRRALHDRWQNPGDIAQFRGISLTQATQMSSRFIQRNNQLRGESIRISWDFSTDNWINTLGLQDLRATVSMQDMFYLSTMRAERGIDFPFARGVNFNISARF